jgi:hypothetical protein
MHCACAIRAHAHAHARAHAHAHAASLAVTKVAVKNGRENFVLELAMPLPVGMQWYVACCMLRVVCRMLYVVCTVGIFARVVLTGCTPRARGSESHHAWVVKSGSHERATVSHATRVCVLGPLVGVRACMRACGCVRTCVRVRACVCVRARARACGITGLSFPGPRARERQEA